MYRFLTLTLLASALALVPAVSQAQIIIIPNCELEPNDPFCQEQCQIDPTLPWCVPPEPKRNPVVIVPGLAASHNRQCILKDRCAPDVGTWDFTPTIDWYDPLIERLISEGYTQGQDLFIAYYDWRQSNIESAVEYLVPTINQAKAATGAAKVDIIAHSMGGLVARAYIQSGPQYRDDVDQLIMLGTPNEGVADAYTVWESGELPDRWSWPERIWVGRIESALKGTRDQDDLKRPLSYRAFFPSLAELIPINPFVKRDGEQLNSDQLAQGPNQFLAALRDTADRLADIDVTAIAGTNYQTLDQVPINSSRTPDDSDLERWRDGHANPDPPVPDSPAGDQTVLTASAQAVGNTVASLTAQHDELPGQAQDIVTQVLIDNPVGDFVPVYLASAGLGVDVLSPVMPVIHGPNGEILSANKNTFDNAYFDWNSDDPNDIKMLTIINPPEGNYNVTLTGTDTGGYTVITTYADEDETISFEADGTTAPGQEDITTFSIQEETFIPEK